MFLKTESEKPGLQNWLALQLDKIILAAYIGYFSHMAKPYNVH